MTANKFLILIILFIIVAFVFYSNQSNIDLNSDLFTEEREQNLQINTKKLIQAIESNPHLGEQLDQSISERKPSNDLSTRIDEIAKGDELSSELKDTYLASIMANNEESLSIIISKFESLNREEDSYLRTQYLLLGIQVCNTNQTEACSVFFSNILLDENKNIP